MHFLFIKFTVVSYYFCKEKYSSGICASVVGTMKRLDQGHFHPKLKVPGLMCRTRAPTLGGEHLHMAAPCSACGRYTWTNAESTRF